MTNHVYTLLSTATTPCGAPAMIRVTPVNQTMAKNHKKRLDATIAAFAMLVLAWLSLTASVAFGQAAPWQQPPASQGFSAQWRNMTGPSQAAPPMGQQVAVEQAPNADDFSVQPDDAAMGPCGGPGDSCNCAPGPTYGPYCGDWQSLRDGLWFRAEYLLWRTQGAYLPPLLTTSPSVSGASTIIYGGDSVDDGLRSGGILTAGYWLDQGDNIGFQGNFLQLAKSTQQFQSPPNGTSIIARPYFDVESGGRMVFW